MIISTGASSARAPLHITSALAPLTALFRRAGSRTRRTDDGLVHLGSGQPVLVFPTLGAGAGSTQPLRQALDAAGFASHDWSLGIDAGPRDTSLTRWLRRLEDVLIDVFEKTETPVSLVGWGLSGIYARELAKHASPLVRQVITLGTPFQVPADPRRDCDMLRSLDGAPARLTPAVRQRLRQPPPVPLTAIYSKADGRVPWELCAAAPGWQVESIELIDVPHLRLATHPTALEAITHRLAQPEGQWEPFVPETIG